MEYDVRTMRADDLARVLDWAADEGWNPGLDDAAAFLATDPGGFHVGCVDGAPVSSISVVRYGAGFAFLGLYIVLPEHRGTGLGLALWERALGALPADVVVGLDGVVAQQDDYRRSGFMLAHRNARWGGPVAWVPDASGAVRDLHADDLPLVAAYDADVFPAARDAFLTAWLAGPGRRTVGHVEDGRLRGYGTIRRCREGWKVGPLVADTPEVAASLIGGLVAPVAPGPVFVDVPEPNAEAVALATRMGLAPAFETARMYRGPAPDLPLDRVFGITTLELG